MKFTSFSPAPVSTTVSLPAEMLKLMVLGSVGAAVEPTKRLRVPADPE